MRCRACVARIVKKRRLCANRRVSPEKRRLCAAGVWRPEKWRMCAEGMCRQEKAFVRLGTCVIRRMKLRPVRGEMVSFIANGGALCGAAAAAPASQHRSARSSAERRSMVSWWPRRRRRIELQVAEHHVKIRGRLLAIILTVCVS